MTNKTKNALEERAFSQLESLRSNKSQQVKEYLQERQNQLLAFSKNLMVTDAMNEFNYSFFHDADNNFSDEYKSSITSYYENQFNGEYQARNNESVNTGSIIPESNYALYHQYQYISNSEFPLGEKDKLDKADGTGLYDIAHEKYHPVIRDYLNKFGYYDIFLVEPESGYIVYSVFKEIDYATSLIDGPHKNSNIAKVYKTAVTSQKTSVVHAQDYEPYLPSFDAPASFVATPVYDSGRLLGVVIFQMPVDRINSYMNDADGLGETGQVYLLGEDKLMRNQSRLTDDKTLLTTKIDSPTAQKALAGESGLEIFENENGNAILSAYAPLIMNGYNWVILAEIDQSEAFSVISSIVSTLLQVGLVLILAVVALAYFVMCSVNKELGGDPTDLLKIANDIVNGKLDREISQKDRKAKGVYAAMITMQDTLKESIETDRKKSRRIERVKQALDSVKSCVIVADVDLEIIYSNNSATELFLEIESDYRKELPSFNAKSLVGSEIGVLYKDADSQRKIFNELSKTIVSDITVAGHAMRTTASPIITDDNERIGTVIEWRDMTSEIAVENEVQSLVDSALDGDLSKRISIDNKSGFLSRLSVGINDLVNVSERVINDTIRVLSAVSHGDLNEKIESEYKGSFNQLKTDVNNTIDKLTNIVGNIKESSVLVNTAADEISRGNMNLSQRTENQAASLEETSSSMEEMTSSVKQNADNSKHANELAIGAREQAQKSGDVVSEAVTAMAKINDASNKIAEITGVIDEIAFQTNLLALNAAVEAARAGEQGRGFAVVATEVRNLAGRSATAAKEIKELIEDSVDKVEHGSDLVNQSGKTLEEIVDSIKQVAEIIGDISYASNEQASGIEQVNKAIISMDETTQNNAALVEQAAAAAESMNEQSNELMNLVGFFNLEGKVSGISELSNNDLNDMASNPSQSNSLPSEKFKKVAGDGIISDDWEQF
ncbi:MAG: methyl-accepting chemotaxis protein [Gammaproteobacteria bacterium]